VEKVAHRVLIVDDAAFMRMMIKDILVRHGYEVVGEAADGVQAVEKYQELRPDVVTMDITMPEMDGIQALREIRNFDPDARVIICSAMGQQTLVVDAVQAGAIDFVVKPFHADRVIEALQRALK
jgi:two-component system chemotaxis response regulator CheY